MPKQVPHTNSDEEWAALLHEVGRQAKVQPQPFFYARVSARLAAKTQRQSFWLPSWVRRPAYVALLGALVLAVSSDGTAAHPAARQYDGAPPAQTALPAAP